MPGNFYLFINFNQALRLGHVGWGFQIDESGLFLFGSTDHLYHHPWWDLPAWVDYLYVAPGEKTDFWCQTGDEGTMLETMSSTRAHIWYHACKKVKVGDASPAAARKTVDWLETAGWSLLVNNCVQHTYSIATEYGVGRDMPDPWRSAVRQIPRVWFAAVEGEYIELRAR